MGASGGIFGLIGACVADIIKNWRLIFSDFINKGRSKRQHVTVVLILLLDIFLNLLLGLTPFTDNFMREFLTSIEEGAHFKTNLQSCPFTLDLGGFIIGLLCASTMLDLVDLFGRGNGKLNRTVAMTFLSRFFGVIVSFVLMVIAIIVLFNGDGLTTPCQSCSVLSCVSFPPWASYGKLSLLLHSCIPNCHLIWLRCRQEMVLLRYL